MITNDQHELLKDIINNTETPYKLTLSLDHVSKSLTVQYEDLDEEWFRELSETIGYRKESSA